MILNVKVYMKMCQASRKGLTKLMGAPNRALSKFKVTISNANNYGANKAEYLDFIKRHSLREIYQIALYTEVDDITRLFFLNSVIERFREVVRKLPAEKLEKCQHPIPLLFQIYKEHPDIFEFKPKKYDKSPKNQRK
uniref:Uncharacterized protein n=1 Tax=Panagrolaimus davidi TaxID=227884 RepID=A0A914QEL4_9BILA